MDQLLADSRGEEWSSARSAWGAERYVQTSRDRLAKLAVKWSQDSPVRTRQELRQQLSRIFGEARANTIAKTETTRAFSF